MPSQALTIKLILPTQDMGVATNVDVFKGGLDNL